MSRLKNKKVFWVVLKWPAIFLLILLLIALYFLRRPTGTVTSNFHWGVVFSKIFSEQLGLDWRENYSAIVEDLKPEVLRLPIYWQDIEKNPDQFSFEDYDWMISQANKNNLKFILVVGRKTPRWPECNLPEWVNKFDEIKQKEATLRMLKTVEERYKDEKNLVAWQVENEPFLNFGECPLWGGDFLDQEIAVTKKIDANHPVIITDSGELSYWFQAAKRADIFGTTMYRIIFSSRFGYVKYPLPPSFFWLKANFVRLFYPDRPITVSELQAEPWGPNLLYNISLEEQMKSMNHEQLPANIEYAKQVGFSEIHLWGAEWWWWMKTKQNDDFYWEYVKKEIQR